MKKNLTRIAFVLSILFCNANVQAQLIQGTVKSGTNPNQVDIFLKPDFNFTGSYIFQYQFPIAFPANATPQPTNITFTKDANFSAVEEQGGASFTVSISAKANNTAVTVNYFVITLVRTGSTTYSRNSGVEYKVGTVSFGNAAPPPAAQEQVKLADFQDGGSDGQGNFYSVDAANNYYVTSTSTGNFYASPGNSTTGGTATEGFARTINNIVLPVNLLSFAATKASASRSLISWVTASEEAASYFEVERSITGNAASFRSIGVRTPATNGNKEVSYQAYDETPSVGANYYRLKMVDISGKVTYSDTRIVRFDNRGAFETVSLFPNPIRVEGQEVKLTVNVITAQAVDYTLVDVTGKLIYNGKLDVTAGSANYKIAGFDNLAPGSYFLHVKGETLNDNIKVLKAN